MKQDFQNQQPSYLNERKKFINNAQPIQGQTFDQYKEQQDQFNKEKESIEAPASFHKTRKLMIFKGNYLIVTLSFLLLIINSILRGFTGTWWYLLPNLVFLVVFLIFASYFNPLDYASDTDKYIRANVDKVYLDLQHIVKVLLKLLGHNLTKNTKSSWRVTQFLLFLGTIFAVLFYNSGFAILSIPFFITYIARVFASGETKEAAKKLRLTKWFLFLILVANTILSAIWKTPFGYETVVLISFLNTMQLWLQNTEIYGLDVIHRLKAEEQRRVQEEAERRFQEEQARKRQEQIQQQMFAQQQAQQMQVPQGYPQQQQPYQNYPQNYQQ